MYECQRDYALWDSQEVLRRLSQIVINLYILRRVLTRSSLIY